MRQTILESVETSALLTISKQLRVVPRATQYVIRDQYHTNTRVALGGLEAAMGALGVG